MMSLSGEAPGGPFPLRIASLQPSITLTLQRLGRLDDLVACTRYCVEALPELASRNLKIIADSWSSTMEELLAVEPNLVLASVPYRMESLAAILRAGCPVLSSDRVVHDLYLRPDVRAAVVERLGNGILGADGEVDRAALGQRAFSDPNVLA